LHIPPVKQKAEIYIQAGVIIASAFILYSLIFGLEKGYQLLPPKFNFFLLALGAFIYGSVGLITMLIGDLFLSYNVLGTTKQSGQHIGILLVEFGVGLTVSNVMIALFNAFAGFDFKKIKK
jgi:multicomponent Na+:H+ antiporter subunit B